MSAPPPPVAIALPPFAHQGFGEHDAAFALRIKEDTEAALKAVWWSFDFPISSGQAVSTEIPTIARVRDIQSEILWPVIRTAPPVVRGVIARIMTDFQYDVLPGDMNLEWHVWAVLIPHERFKELWTVRLGELPRDASNRYANFNTWYIIEDLLCLCTLLWDPNSVCEDTRLDVLGGKDVMRNLSLILAATTTAEELTVARFKNFNQVVRNLTSRMIPTSMAVAIVQRMADNIESADTHNRITKRIIPTRFATSQDGMYDLAFSERFNRDASFSALLSDLAIMFADRISMSDLVEPWVTQPPAHPLGLLFVRIFRKRREMKELIAMDREASAAYTSSGREAADNAEFLAGHAQHALRGTVIPARKQYVPVARTPYLSVLKKALGALPDDIVDDILADHLFNLKVREDRLTLSQIMSGVQGAPANQLKREHAADDSSSSKRHAS